MTLCWHLVYCLDNYAILLSTELLVHKNLHLVVMSMHEELLKEDIFMWQQANTHRQYVVTSQWKLSISDKFTKNPQLSWNSFEKKKLSWNSMDFQS